MPVPWRALFCKAAGGPFYPCWLAKTIRPERWFNILVGSPAHGTPKPLKRITEQEYLHKTNFLLSLEMAPTPSPAS